MATPETTEQLTDPEANRSADQSEVSADKLKNNPYIVNAGTGEAKLVIREREPFVPWPFKKIKHVILVSYVCYLFFVFPGAIANNYAWEAKKYKDLGAWSEAKEMARAAVKWIYVGFAIGLCCAVILAIVLPLTI